ncbi:hypothetical protein CY35_05G048700 [Sphagnum magellanicum]|nr:hypothetical protein CY35_05G048700 [Sphagnum magellanicum]KAH9561956.1 hypothetical protein CY35_05G048700 [Sphagnum magellanicum]
MAVVCLQRPTVTASSSPSSHRQGYGSLPSFHGACRVLQFAGGGLQISNLQLHLCNARRAGNIDMFICSRSWKYEKQNAFRGGVQQECRSQGLSHNGNTEQGETLKGDSCAAETPLLPTESAHSTFFPFAAIAIAFSQVVRFLSVLTTSLQKRKSELLGVQLQVDTGAQGIERDEELANTSLLQQGGLGMALLSTSMIAKDRISPILLSLRENPTFMSGLIAWAIAQVMKVFTTYFLERRWDLKMLLGSGGMPSSHSALCVGLTTSVALCHGVSDCLFPVCLGFTLIVMYDAAGVRRHAGRQAEVLNMIVEDLFQGHPVSERKLKELLGHTPLQVGAGAFLGMLCGFLCSRASMVY